MVRLHVGIIVCGDDLIHENGLGRESTKAEVMRMNFVGKAVIQVEPGNTFFHGMQNLIGGTAESYEEVDSFEIIIKPKKRKDIKPVVGNALHAISDDHVRKIVVNAKRETEERLEEFPEDHAATFSRIKVK